eukprot:g1356.t1
MQSHLMNKRRSEVSVAPLRPLALNRATSEILPYRGTLFLKVIKGTQLVQAPQLAPSKESKSKLARLSAFLGDVRAEAGAMMHAVSVTSWLTDAEPDGGGDSPDRRPSMSDTGGSFSSPSGGGGGAGSASPPGAGAGHGGGGGAGRGGVVWRTPKPDAARTSPKFISHGDPEGGASWDEEFFFGRVSGDIAVRIVCIDKPLGEGAEDEVVGELLIPVSRLPQNEPVEQWYGLEPPVGSGKTFTKAALLLRFLFTTSASPDAKTTAAAAATAATSGAAKGTAGGPMDGRRRQSLGSTIEEDRLPTTGAGGGGAGGGAAESAASYRGAGQPGSGAGDDSFKRALFMAGVNLDGSGGDGGGAAASKMRSWKGLARPGAGTGEEFAVNPGIDPYGADEIEDDGGGGRAEDDADAQRGEPTMLRAQQLQLGNWGNTNLGTVHVGAAAAEAALALSTDEILPAGLVDYFLVVGPATDEAGKLRVADYADCGFGSTGTAPTPGGGVGVGELPATAVEVESAVLEHFPEEQREDAPFPTKVEWFCFPQGLFLRSAASQPAPHVSSFVRFTSGVRSYGLCLTFYRQVGVLEESNPFVTDAASRGGKEGESVDGSGRSDGGDAPRKRKGRLWCPVCLCVLTHIPVLEGLMHWLRMFHWCLVRLEKESGQRKRVSRRPTELDAAVFQLTLEVPLPVPGVCAMSTRAFGKRFAACPEPEFSLPGIRELPALSFPLGLLLRSLRPKGVLELFAAILQEGRILLHSTKPALLAAVAEGVFALMYPLQWPYAYVPVLPNCLIEHVESPQPFILGVHTDWLSDISPDALEELIIVDCDLGTVDGPDMGQLPPPVRRSLTKAVRAVLHGNLGNLDAPVRLSKPEMSAAAAAAQSRGEMSARSKGGAFPFSQQPGTSASSNGLGRTVTAVGLSAWTDPVPRAGGAAAGNRDGVGQGGGEKSAEAGDTSSRGRSGSGGGGDVTVRKARRGRARGVAARMEALLRLEFARAMADMLYGFTECLFFLQPDRPIFNGARFLQEYCEESYVPFMSVVIDTLAFKYLLETQDSPPLRPFHDMLDKARRDALKKGGDLRKHVVQPGQDQGTNEPAAAATGTFDGPFPIVNGFDELSVSRPKSFDAAGEAEGEAGSTAARAAGGGGGGLPPPAFAIPSPPLASFTRPPGDGDESDREEEEVDFNASRSKEGDGIGGGGGGGGGGSAEGSGPGGRGGSGGGGAEEAEQAAEEVREQPPPPYSAAVDNATTTSSGGNNSSRLPGAAPARRSSDGGGFKSRAKKEERSGVRLSDARGGFIGGSMVKGAGAGSHRQDRSSVEEADEMAGEGEGYGGGEKGKGRIRRQWPSAGRRSSGASSSASSSWRPRNRAQEIEVDCYDSAGDWGSDGSDGLPAVLAARKKGTAEDTAAETAAAAGEGHARRTGSSLSMGGAAEGADVGHAESGTVQQKATEAEAAGGADATAGQSAGESALEEEDPGSSGLTVGEGTAPPAPPAGTMSPGRAAAIAAAAARRKSSGGGSSREGSGGSRGGGGGGGGGGGTVRERVAALSAKTGGSSVRDRVAMFSAPKKTAQSGGRGHGGGAGSDGAPARRPSLGLDISMNTDEDDDGRPRISARAPKKAMGMPGDSEGEGVSPSHAPPSYAAVASKRPSIPGIAEEKGSPAARASEEEDSAPREDPAEPPAKAGLSRRGEGVGVPPLAPSSSASSSAVPRRRSSGVESFSMGDSASGSLCGPERQLSSASYDDYDYPFEPVDAPLSRVDWSHEPVLRLSGCDLPQPREWTLADIGKEIEEDLGQALRAQTDGSANAGLGHGAYSLKAGAGLAAAAGAGDGEELDRDSEKLLQCLEAVYSSDRVSEEVVMSVEETLKTAPEVQKMFLQVLRHASQRGYANSRGPTLLHGPSFETLARFSYTLLCVCVDRVDYSVAHTLLQLTGNYFQVHEGGADVFRGGHSASRAGGAGKGQGVGGGVDEEGLGEQPGYFSEFLSARISRHPIFTDMRFWQHVLSEAVQAKTEKIAKDRHTLASAMRDSAGKDKAEGGESLLSSPGSPDDGPAAAASAASNLLGKNPAKNKLDAEANRALEFKDPALASEIVCRQVKVFLYEMASIGMRAKTAQRYVEAVSLQYKLQPAARNRLSETVRLVWGAVASMSGPGSPPFGSELTPEMSAAQAGWSQARMDADADAEIGIPSGPTVPAIPGVNPGNSRSAATSVSSFGGGSATAATPVRSAATPSSAGGMSPGGGGGGASGRPNSASSAFSAGTGTAATAATSKLPTLRLSASELVNQLQMESSPSPRMPTTPASGGRGRFRSPGTGGGNKSLSATYSPSSGGGGIIGRGGGSGRTTPSSRSPPMMRRSRTQSPGSGPPAVDAGGGGSSSTAGADGPIPAGTWAPGSVSGGGGGGGGHGRSRSRGSDGGGTEAALSPRRPLVGARAGMKPAAGPGPEEAEEAPVSPGRSGAALAARRFFFGGTETVRSLASSLSPPEKKSGGAVEPASTLPSSPTAVAPAPALGLVKSVSSSGSIGGEGTGKGWAEMVSGGKGELPSLLAPVELHGRDGEGATHHGPILCLAAFESRACAGSTDGTLSVYDLSLVSRVGVLSGHTGPVTTVSCGDDWVLSGSSDSSLRLWQNGGDNASSTTPPRRGFISLGWQAPANTGTFKSRVLAGHQGPITCVSSHPRRVDGKPWLAVSGGEDNQIRMWDLRTRRCKVIFTGHSKAITCLTALREDGSNLVLSGAKDCTVRLWDINEASGCKALRKFSGHEGSVGSILKIGPFAAVSCSNDRTLRTWDHRVKGSVGVLRGHTGPVTCVQQSPANRSVLASGSADGTVMMWDVRKTAKGPSFTLRGHTDRVTGLLASGGSVYSCSEDASMQEWEWETGQLKTKFFGGRSKTVGVAATRGGGIGGGSGGISCLAGTGSAVLTAGWDKTVRLWPRSSPAPQSQVAVAAAAAAAAASALRR